MYSRQQLSDGRVRVTGGKRLKASGAYPPRFGKFVAQTLRKHKLRAPQLNNIVIFLDV